MLFLHNTCFFQMEVTVYFSTPSPTFLLAMVLYDTTAGLIFLQNSKIIIVTIPVLVYNNFSIKYFC
nr:MAG TPA_asm: hypothetical protein [Caudoviricetes sp.]